jgi:microcystin-dependent protein
MERKDGKQVLATKYIIRRIVALLIVATLIAVPALLGAYSYERDNNDNHNKIDDEENSLSYSQVEPHVRSYLEREREPDDSASGSSGSGEVGGGVATPDTLPVETLDVAVGTVLIYAGDDPPEGFLKCDGREVSRSRYKDLYSVIGDKYGDGDGVTTFNLPDMKSFRTTNAAAAYEAYYGAYASGIAGYTAESLGFSSANTVAATFTLAPLDATDSARSRGCASGTPRAAADTPVFKKTSEETGPPPVVDLDEEERYDSDEEPASRPQKSEAAVMYFIIKY